MARVVELAACVGVYMLGLWRGYHAGRAIERATSEGSK